MDLERDDDIDETGGAIMGGDCDPDLTPPVPDPDDLGTLEEDLRADVILRGRNYVQNLLDVLGPKPAPVTETRVLRLIETVAKATRELAGKIREREERDRMDEEDYGAGENMGGYRIGPPGTRRNPFAALPGGQVLNENLQLQALASLFRLRQGLGSQDSPRLRQWIEGQIEAFAQNLPPTIEGRDPDEGPRQGNTAYPVPLPPRPDLLTS